jgi:hypothetical protein
MIKTTRRHQRPGPVHAPPIRRQRRRRASPADTAAARRRRMRVTRVAATLGRSPSGRRSVPREPGAVFRPSWSMWLCCFSASMNGYTFTGSPARRKPSSASRSRHPQPAGGSPAATGQLGPLVTGQPVAAAALVQLRLLHPLPDRGLGQVVVLRHLTDRPITPPRGRHDIGLELRRERTTRPRLLPARHGLHDGHPPGAEAPDLGCPSRRVNSTRRRASRCTGRWRVDRPGHTVAWAGPGRVG